MKIAVAYIKGPRGFKGELAAVLYKPSSNSIRTGVSVTLSKNESTAEFEVEFTKLLKNRIAVKLKGLDSEEDVKKWQGADILIEKDELEPLGKQEFYNFELIGAEVVDSDGKKIGIIENIDNNAGNDLLVIKSGDEEILIPFVKAIVRKVDIGKRTVEIESIEGLV